ncbi:MAG: hypothetical protein JO228_03510, partial [Xanthobacteraceae bacterium]|nr:hypothetical protein [Xanthobacteraceae bacterium]
MKQRPKHRSAAKAAAPRKSGKTTKSPEQLLHELEVHQGELEMQNEELRTARATIEAALEHYIEVFDYAPIGYATLDRDLVIRELNH